MIKQIPGVLYWVLNLLLLTFSFQCENPIEAAKEDRRVIIVRRECANAATNTNNLFAVCGAGSVDDPFRIVHELQLIHLSDPVNQAAAWDATACDGGRCNFKLIDDLNMDGMTLNGPIGTAVGADSFNANFDGNGKTISNLTINLPATDNVGLFGYIEVGLRIDNIHLINTNIHGNEHVGGLVGFNDGGTIVNSSVTGSVIGETNFVGGLVGLNTGAGSIESSYSAGSVTGGQGHVGGFIGINGINIERSYSTASVTITGGINAGGFVGANTGTGGIENSYSTGSMVDTGGNSVGGFVGVNQNSIENSYTTSTVNGVTDVGGIAGVNNPPATMIGTNYFTDNDGADGIGNGTCTPGTCTQQSLAGLRDTLNEGAVPLNWDPAIWGALGEAGSFPCLRNMPSGARSCP